MTKVMLINPPYINPSNIQAHLPVQRYPPLGLLYLASMLQKNKFDVAIIDAPATGLSILDVERRVIQSNPHVVGFYVTSFVLPQVSQLISRIRERMNIHIVIGGPHVTHHPYSIKELDADYGIIGDGEKNFVNLLNAIINNKKRKSIPGLIYRENEKIFTTKKSSLENLDSLPFPARNLIPNKNYYSPLFDGRITTMITSRGCIHDCIFCALPNKKTYRIRSPKNIIKEIEQLDQHEYHYIEIQDDFFTLNKKIVQRVCNLIVNKKLKIKWGCETKIDSVNNNLLDSMKKAGCINIKYGIESGCERIRNNIIKKKINEKQMIKIMKYTKRIGMETIAYFTLGHPTETKRDLEKTLELAKKLNPDYIDFHLMTPIPGSKLFNIALRESRIDKDIWSKVQYDGKIPFYYPKDLTLQQLMKFKKKAYNSFYFNPSKILKELYKVKNFKDFYSKIKCGLTILKS